MEACSVARIMSLEHFGLKFLPKLLALSPGSLGKFRKVSPPMETETVLKKLPELPQDVLREVSPPMETETLVRNLPELPQDVLMDIFSLLEIPDLMRAASVSSSWRSAYTSLCSQLEQYKRPQTPCLLYTSESAGENVACLYSLAEKRVYKLTLPDPPIRNRYLIGSSHGWLVTADDKSELHLINPVTGQQIALPSVVTIGYVEPIFGNEGTLIKYELWDQLYDPDLEPEMLSYAPDELRNHVYIRAFIFPDPSTGSYIVVLIHGPGYQLSFARVGDCKWTPLPPGWDYEQCIYMDGLLYASTKSGRMDAFDLTSPNVTRNIIADEIDIYSSEYKGVFYLLQAPWGDLLQVCRKAKLIDAGYEELIVKTNKVLLHKVNMEAEELVEINSLHHNVLFLGCNQSLCLSAEEYPQLKANCVYFTDDEECNWKYKTNPRDIGVLNLEDDSREEIISPLWCSWPSPIWITPSLTVMNLSLCK
ncbi:putative F-box protein At4g22660 [Triticum dicoccoides]|uniref:putative F-box protein At4g22660 n=1 Tax=Triticum dicoccoides TaxID=85692 RepID=UPI000E79DFFE|nr:putative F-box protein At4g22660 [Triticum dicoccoides]